MFYPRLIYSQLRNSLNKKEVTVLTGMRRTGKTSLLTRLYQEAPDNKLFLDLENRANHELFYRADYDDLWRQLEIKYGLDPRKKAFIFLDEIQNLPIIPSVMKYLVDHYSVKFVVTGSASYYLKNLFSESLSGRKILFELFPLTFSEFLVFNNYLKKLSQPMGLNFTNGSKILKTPEVLTGLYARYLKFGGFPGVVLAKTPAEKEQKLKDILYSYIDTDVKKLSDFKKIGDMENLIRLLVPRVGQKIEMSRLASESRLSRQTVQQYLEFLEMTYFLFRLQPFTKNIGREISKAEKLYLCDTGLANVLGSLSSGQQLENTVFNNLRVKFQPKFAFEKIRYYQKPGGAEVDFILGNNLALEVKETGSIFNLRRLKRICARLGISHCFIISKNFSSEEKIVFAPHI